MASTTTQPLATRIPNGQADKLKQLADGRGLTVAALLAEIVAIHLAESGDPSAVKAESNYKRAVIPIDLSEGEQVDIVCQFPWRRKDMRERHYSIFRPMAN